MTDMHVEDYRDRNILDGDRLFYVESAVAALVCAGILVFLSVALRWVG